MRASEQRLHQCEVTLLGHPVTLGKCAHLRIAADREDAAIDCDRAGLTGVVRAELAL